MASIAAINWTSSLKDVTVTVISWESSKKPSDTVIVTTSLPNHSSELSKLIWSPKTSLQSIWSDEIQVYVRISSSTSIALTLIDADSSSSKLIFAIKSNTGASLTEFTVIVISWESLPPLPSKTEISTVSSPKKSGTAENVIWLPIILKPTLLVPVFKHWKTRLFRSCSTSVALTIIIASPSSSKLKLSIKSNIGGSLIELMVITTVWESDRLPSVTVTSTFSKPLYSASKASKVISSSNTVQLILALGVQP